MFKSSKSISGRNLLQYILLSLVLVYFLSFVLYRLGDVFELSGDDIDKGVFSQCFIRMFLHGENCLDLRNSLMLNPYVGQVQQYLGSVFLVLFSGLWGPVFVLKLTVVFLGLAGLVCGFLVLRYFFNPWVALLTVFFTGTNCVYIQSVRYGFVREEILQIAGLWFGLYLLVRGHRSRQRGWIYAGLFVFGVTLWAKTMFLGYMAGAFAGMFVLGKSDIRGLRRFLFPSVGTAVLRIGTFCLGFFPLVLYNLIVQSGRTAYVMLWLYKEAGVVGSLKMLAGVFLLRLDDISMYCLGTLYRADYGANWFGAVLVLCAFVWCIRLVFVLPENSNRRKFLAFVLVAYTVLLLLSCFIIIVHSKEHVVIAEPFAGLLCAVFVVDVCGRLKSRKAVVALAAVVVTGWLGFNVRYEVTRIANRNSLKGYLPKDFQVSDMTAVVGRLQELGVRNLYCSNFLSSPVVFFWQGENPIVCRGVDKPYETRIDVNKPWFLLTGHESLTGMDAEALHREYGDGVVKLERVEVFDTPLSCRSKIYLFRIHKS